jgi:hypothetical protein
MASVLKVDKLDPQSGTALEVGTSGDTITVPSGATFVVAGTTEITGTNNVQLPTANPLIINGNMAVAQRGTSETTASGYGTVDRFRCAFDSGAVTATQDTSVPTGYGFAKSWKLDTTTAVTSITANHLGTAQYRFEGQDLQLLKFGTANAEKITVSFWVKSTKIGTFICELENTDSSRTCSQAYTVSVTNTWEQKIVNFPADTTGTFTNDNGESLRITWFLFAGTDYTSGTLATTWESTTAANRCVGQVNALDSTSNDFLLTGIQMDVGEYTSSTIPPFQHESYGDNLLRCQRYYQLVGTAIGAASNTTSAYMNPVFATTMRTTPTVGVQGVLSVNDPAVGNLVQSSANATLHNGNETGAFVEINNLSGITANDPIMSRFLNTNKYQFSAEL